MTYHLPAARPYCFLSLKDHDPRTLPPRVSWAQDQAAGCADHMDADSSKAAMATTPTCKGCARKRRAEMIRAGKVAEYEPVKTGQMPKEPA